MALQKSLSFDNGISLPSAYISIYSITIEYINPKSVLVKVMIHKDLSTYNNGSPEYITMEHKCSGSDFTTYFAETVLDDSGKTLLTQGYVWLLSLSMYSGAIEV